MFYRDLSTIMSRFSFLVKVYKPYENKRLLNGKHISIRREFCFSEHCINKTILEFL